MRKEFNKGAKKVSEKFGALAIDSNDLMKRINLTEKGKCILFRYLAHVA